VITDISEILHIRKVLQMAIYIMKSSLFSLMFMHFVSEVVNKMIYVKYKIVNCKIFTMH